MKLNHAFPDSSLVGTVLSLAHATFYDALPANAERRAPIAPEGVTALKHTSSQGVVARAFAAIDGWFWQQRQKDFESYLGQASDLADLERRLRKIERHPYH